MAGPLAVLACLALLAGCGGGDSDSSDDRDSSASASASTSDSASDSPSSSPSSSSSSSTTTEASSSAAPSPASTAQGAAFAALSGDEISNSAKVDMLTLQAVHYNGSVQSGSSTVTLDVHAKASGDCTGTVGIQGGTATVLAVGGSSWFKGDRKFWKAAAGSSADAIIKAVGDKWVVDTNRDFAQFCVLSDFLTNLFNSSGTYTTKGTSEVDGQQVVAVERTADGDQPSTGLVRTDGKHYLVRIERASGGKQGQLDFSDFDQDFTVQAPASDDVVDPSTLG